ncbi:MAG: TetR/AcrR family transcriptional regulator [Betaproteobacteria bacterium]
MSRGSETSERIVCAARKLFAKKGYEGATMAEIAREAEITEGAIYRHFTDKKELFMACVAPVVEEAFSRSLAEVGEAAGIRGMMRAIVEVRLDLLERHLESFDILFSEVLHRQELQDLLWERIKTQIEGVGSALEKVRRAGHLSRRPNLLILGLGMTVAMWAILSFRNGRGLKDFLGIPTTREHLADDFTEFMLYGIAGEPAGRDHRWR